MDFKELAHKKVLGVPTLYLAGAGVIGLALVAWKLKPASTTPDATTATTDTTAQPDTGDPGSGSADFSGLDVGTSSALPGTAGGPAIGTTVATDTNDAWGTRAISWLISQNKATPGDAQLAITTYLNGQDLTYAQGQLRDDAVKQFQLPPESLPGVGQTGSQPAQKQFTSFPGVHTVKGSNDTKASQLSALYYGNTLVTSYQLIEAANPQFGHTGIFPVGTKVTIPAFHAVSYYTANSTHRNLGDIAAANGLSSAGLQILNPTTTFPVAVGFKVRVS